MPELPTPLAVTSPAPDPWVELQAFTAARIALGRSGTSVPLHAAQSFKLAHAHARDAVYSTLSTNYLLAELQAMQLSVIQVRSRAQSRTEYLQRPDWGRQLDDDSRKLIVSQASSACTLAIILADGLSANAINDHALPLLRLLVPQLQNAGFHLTPIIIAEQARVAIGDEIGQLLNTQLTLMLIGERPGLSSPHSMGAYFTYGPRPGLTDESRNCISNIRPEGLTYTTAATKLCTMLSQALQLKLTGIALKEQSDLLKT
jgi:ethanolamine ammonia-lyase small subunit